MNYLCCLFICCIFYICYILLIISIYNCEKINKFMKKINNFDNYIRDIRFLLKISLLIILCIVVVNFINIDIFYKDLIFFIIDLLEIFIMYDFIKKYINVYKNTYSKMIEEK